jgi:hypothetical protein
MKQLTETDWIRCIPILQVKNYAISGALYSKIQNEVEDVVDDLVDEIIEREVVNPRYEL